jgi:pyruvate ferredoxin oxidoreductase alpha subunit
MVMLDAFILSHTVEPVDFPELQEVDKFLPPYRPKHAYLDPEDPMILGSFTPPEYIQEVRYQTEQSMNNARDVVSEVTKEFGKAFGRNYGGMVEEYQCDDAEVILITTGTVTSTAREVVDEYRAQGKKVGLLKLRFFRPFPRDKLKAIASNLEAIGVYDRSVSFGSGGPTFIETRHSLYGFDIPILNFLAGLGGRDVKTEDIRYMFDRLLDAKEGKVPHEIYWIGTRGVEL